MSKNSSTYNLRNKMILENRRELKNKVKSLENNIESLKDALNYANIDMKEKDRKIKYLRSTEFTTDMINEQVEEYNDIIKSERADADQKIASLGLDLDESKRNVKYLHEVISSFNSELDHKVMVASESGFNKGYASAITDNANSINKNMTDLISAIKDVKTISPVTNIVNGEKVTKK